MVERTNLTSEQLAANFSDLHPAYSRDEAVAEASRCLYCYDAPCTRACPADIDVPRFIRQILHDNPAGAAETIFDENIFGGSCARACPTEVLCEGACVDVALVKEPVQIGRLQRYATDFAMHRGLRFFEPGEDTGKRVAIVGAGPAGLSCAMMLRRQGHQVSVFEARDVAGGLNTLGIAAYKISTEFALAELEQILEMGIDLHLSFPVDAARFRELREEYDAVFMAVGLGSTAALGLPGEELDGVWEALDFIFQIHTGPLEDCKVGDRVVVIGAGNTAIDVATQAVRLGASEVTIVYRRSAEEMSAFTYEYELAKADGVRFIWQVRPTAFQGENGHLTGVQLEPVALPEGDGLQPPTVGVANREQRTENSEHFVLPCDMAVKALGQTPLEAVLGTIDGLQFDRGKLVVDRATGATSLEGVFGGGDCITKGAEIVDAVQQGKIAAAGIHAYLTAS